MGGDKQVQLWLEDRTPFLGTVVGVDQYLDLAYIRLDGVVANAPRLPLHDSSGVSAGQEIYVLGYPLGYTGPPSLTRGLVARVYTSTMSNGEPVTVIQTDAAINIGNSGGPVLNRTGGVIGVVFGNEGPDVGGIGYATSANDLKRVINFLGRGGNTLVPATPSPTPEPNTGYGKWSTWSELKARYPDEVNPYVNLRGNGPYPTLYAYSFQVICFTDSNELDVAVREVSTTDFYLAAEFSTLPTHTEIDRQDFGTQDWFVQNEEDSRAINYYPPESLVKRIINLLSNGASRVELTQSPGKEYSGLFTFDTRGSKEALKPVLEACR